MTREAKIGMLTGLGVIILIGVLLSKYLGDPNATFPGALASHTINATGRMAELPVGAAYRQQVLAPVSVPPMGFDNAQGIEGTPTIPSAPVAYAVETTADLPNETQAGPIVRAPVSPQAAGQVPTLPQVAGGPPVITLPDGGVHAVMLPNTRDERMSNSASATATVTYTIAAGDNLNKIARKYYNSNKTVDLQRIIAANPGQLKDVNSPLIQGHKLMIPGVPVSGAGSAPVLAAKPDPGIIPLPGNVPPSAIDPARKLESPRKPATASYVVQPGDTLQKIAHKLAPSKTAEMVQKIMALNGIKDPDSVQAGTKLKVPAPADTHLAAAGGK